MKLIRPICLNYQHWFLFVRGVTARACVVLAGLALAAGTIPAVASAAVGAGGSAQLAIHHYRLIDLGTLGGKFARAMAVNQRGDVVGESTRPSGFEHAFLWRNGKMTDLGALSGPSGFSTALAVNNRDQVVGISDGHAFLWQRGRMTGLGTFGRRGSEASAINDRGQIVGETFGGAIDHGFLWQRGKMTKLPFAAVTGINNAGDIIGIAKFGKNFHAGLLRHGTLTDLGAPGSPSSYSEALQINQRGQIAGIIASPDNHALAVLWQHDTPATLGTPPDDVPVGMNDRGDILVSPSLLWQHGQITDLTNAGVVPVFLNSINDRGELAGAISRNVDGETIIDAALWQPRP